jgi:hypothetical protein
LQRTVVPWNDNLCKVEEALQKEVLQMAEMINTLSIWVQMNVPRIADGNNFGVEVQQEISGVSIALEIVLEILSQYCSRLLKEPATVLRQNLQYNLVSLRV